MPLLLLIMHLNQLALQPTHEIDLTEQVVKDPQPVSSCEPTLSQFAQQAL